MNLSELTGNERLIAEQAVLAYQAVQQTVKTSPEGQGMHMIEQMVRDKGFVLLRRMMELGARNIPRRKKRGLQQSLPLRQNDELSGCNGQNVSHQCRGGDRGAALLRLARLRLQAGAMGPVGGHPRGPQADSSGATDGDPGGLGKFV